MHAEQISGLLEKLRQVLAGELIVSDHESRRLASATHARHCTGCARYRGTG
jgi:hypothetical protein